MTEPETVEEYAHSCRIVRERDDLGEDTYHYEGLEREGKIEDAGDWI
jgi:hypothetical protein